MQGYWIDTVGGAAKARRFQALTSEFDEGIRFLRLPGGLIRYKESGDGAQTIMIAPDPPNTIEYYDRLCTLLGRSFRVVVLELPGFGFSVPTKKGFRFTLDESVSMVEQFMQEVGIEQAVFCFPCVGGFIPLRLAQTSPERVAGIIMVQTPSWPEQKKWARRVDVKGVLATPVVGQLLVKAAKRRIARQWYRAALPRGKDDGSFYSICSHGFDRGAQFPLASAFQGFFKESEFAPVGRLPQRSLVVWGDEDRSHKKSDKESPMGYLEDAEGVHFPEAGHFPELEDPEGFTDRVVAQFQQTR